MAQIVSIALWLLPAVQFGPIHDTIKSNLAASRKVDNTLKVNRIPKLENVKALNNPFNYILEKNGPDNYTHIIGQYCGKANKVYKGLLYVAKNTMLNNYIYVHIITWANIRGVHCTKTS